MKYGYVTPKIEVKVNNVVLPTQTEPTDINISIGEGKFEVEGNAQELLSVGKGMFDLIKDMTAWFKAEIEEIEKKRMDSFIDNASDILNEEIKAKAAQKRAAEDKTEE